MQDGLTHTRHTEVDQELSRIEAYLVELAQEIRETTAAGERYNHTWLQADNAVKYVRTLRAALHSSDEARR